MALPPDVVGDDVAALVERHTGYLLAIALARTDAREKQQIAHATSVRIRAYWLGDLVRVEGIRHSVWGLEMGTYQLASNRSSSVRHWVSRLTLPWMSSRWHISTTE